MSPDTEAWLDDALRGFRQAYEPQGFTFHLEPSPDLLPAFLRDLRPDAIALGPEGGIVIEVTRERSAASDRRATEMFRRVSGQKGWEFRAIQMRPLPEATSPIAAPTKEEIASALSEVEALMEGGHERAAFVTGWAALEALARLASGLSGSTPTRPMASLEAVQSLAADGYFNVDDTDHLRRAVRLRNAIVHGDLSQPVSRDDVLALLGRLRDVADAVGAAPRAHA